MVKECPITINNDVVTVARYGNVDVQFPAIRKKAKSVFVNCENGKYTIVEKETKPKSATKKRRSTTKKTTIEENANATG